MYVCIKCRCHSTQKHILTSVKSHRPQCVCVCGTRTTAAHKSLDDEYHTTKPNINAYASFAFTMHARSLNEFKLCCIKIFYPLTPHHHTDTAYTFYYYTQ